MSINWILDIGGNNWLLVIGSYNWVTCHWGTQLFTGHWTIDYWSLGINWLQVILGAGIFFCSAPFPMGFR